MKLIFPLLVFLPAVLANVELSDFFPVAPGVPTMDENCKSAWKEIIFTNRTVFPFFNSTYDRLFVHSNGVVSFVPGSPGASPVCGRLNIPIISPFWASTDTMIASTGFSRETSDPILLEKATEEVINAFPSKYAFAAEWLLTISWNGMRDLGNFSPCNGLYFSSHFQLNLVTDGKMSFAIIYFNMVDWDGQGGALGDNCTGQGHFPAKFGFDAGDGRNLYELPGSCTNVRPDVSSTGNVDQSGKWVFRLDDLPYWPESYEADGPEQVTLTTPIDTSTPSDQLDIAANLLQLEGTSCDEKACQHIGHCYEYLACDHMTLRWTRYVCSNGFFWNPAHFNKSLDENCTASCDVWDNLAAEIKNLYERDEKCFPSCYYKEFYSCQPYYYFHPHKTDARNIVFERCPVDTRLGRSVPLVWVQQRETCDFCYNAFYPDDTPCCERYSWVEEPSFWATSIRTTTREGDYESTTLATPWDQTFGAPGPEIII